MMEQIRKVAAEDAAAIAGIYNRYVTATTVSFETEPVSEEQMRVRIAQISAGFPYFVYEREGRVEGYCYAHPWKERAAYSRTLETTIYLAPEFCGRGIGTRLMQYLVEECRSRGFRALIACITADNERSIEFHRSLGFKSVSHFAQVGYKQGRWLDVVDLERLLA